MARDTVTQTCSLTHCDLPHRANGYCNTHNQRVLTHGDKADLLKPIRHHVRPPKHIGCLVEGCETPHAARGYCQHHYERFLYYGDPLREPPKGHSANPWKLDDPDFAVYFWNKANVTANPNLCWRWRGNTEEDGYGTIVMGGRMTQTHRIAWALVNGRMPHNDKMVLHSCDNPPCCNPNHLREGTHLENMQDMIERGRSKAQRHDPRLGRGKVTPDDVRVIRQRRANKETIRRIARDLNISRFIVSGIVQKKTWKHVI